MNSLIGSLFVLLQVFLNIYSFQCPSGSDQVPNEEVCMFSVTQEANGLAPYIGVERKQNNTWTYADGSTLGYQNWALNEPNNASNTTVCAIMDPQNGKWLSAECTFARPFICSIDGEGLVDLIAFPFFQMKPFFVDSGPGRTLLGLMTKWNRFYYALQSTVTTVACAVMNVWTISKMRHINRRGQWSLLGISVFSTLLAIPSTIYQVGKNAPESHRDPSVPLLENELWPKDPASSGLPKFREGIESLKDEPHGHCSTAIDNNELEQLIEADSMQTTPELANISNVINQQLSAIWE
ncbi:unnamed protein product, partial [Mesorhabditis belari]|uniref:C-type lectin domain-containing protein n=1 Tax=Mesorhabditis belari TaxID=2138241 RepID=A0AAF3EKP5_9BILA